MSDVCADVCVVGGGPAGLTLALLLLRSGCRVAVVERSRTMDREFRGEILQPGGMRMLAELGVLAEAKADGYHEHDTFALVDAGRVLMETDYRRFPAPFDCLLSVPQSQVLGALLRHCLAHDTVEYLAGYRAAALVTDGGVVRGVSCHGADGTRVVRAKVVVGADGRYSKVRQLAAIDAGRTDVFRQDVLWFKLPAHGAPPRSVRVFREPGSSPVMAYATVPDEIQFGWTLPHGGYRDVAARGIDHIKSALAAAIPPYAEQIRREITSLRDVSLLDVFSACAPEWVRDGLVLIGDSAHAHSPIGAQGINVAIQDAVALHPVLVAALRGGDTSAAALRPFETARRPDVDRVRRIQLMQSRTMLASGRIATTLRPLAARLVVRSPVFRAVRDTLAFGNTSIAIARDLFTVPHETSDSNATDRPVVPGGRDVLGTGPRGAQPDDARGGRQAHERGHA